MDFAIIATISTLLGVVLGASFHKFKGHGYSDNFISTSTGKFHIENQLHGSSVNGFDEFEKRFLLALIKSNTLRIDVSDLNKLLRLEKLSRENQRQRRHIFLKELNIKLSLHLNVRDAIQRESSDLDGRVKLYAINPNVNPNEIENFLKPRNIK